jgi:hypothetical protein
MDFIIIIKYSSYLATSTELNNGLLFKQSSKEVSVGLNKMFRPKYVYIKLLSNTKIPKIINLQGNTPNNYLFVARYQK